MIPQFIIISIWMISLWISIAKHGQKKEKKENAWTTLLAIIIVFIILAYGGFWKGLF